MRIRQLGPTDSTMVYRPRTFRNDFFPEAALQAYDSIQTWPAFHRGSWAWEVFYHHHCLGYGQLDEDVKETYRRTRVNNQIILGG